MKQAHRLVVLPTDNASFIFRRNNVEPNLGYFPGYLELNMRARETSEFNTFWEAVHLYLLSDEVIKEGDWMLNLAIIQREENEIPSQSDGRNVFNKSNDWFKIIATTDISLRRDDLKPLGQFIYLPQFPETFIKKFVESQGKNNRGRC